MRLRYLHLQSYPPIRDIEIAFASGSPLGRACAIRFVVGVNGSGKSNLLRGVAEVFLALEDRRVPPFPVTLAYELGQRGSAEHRTVVVDCPGAKSEASIWISEQFHWPDTASKGDFADVVQGVRAGEFPKGFRAHVARGDWPQDPTRVMPRAVLAYTTGDLRPWRSVWNRDQKGEHLFDSSYSPEDAQQDERPAGWTAAQEASFQAAPRSSVPSGDDPLSEPATGMAAERGIFRRPLLVDGLLLKCALLAVTLPQTLNFYAYGDRFIAALPHEQLHALQKLLERGHWHHLVSIGFRSRFSNQWDKNTALTAHDWWSCASDVIAEPHPVEARRIVFFDSKGKFHPEDHAFLSDAGDALKTATTNGDALLTLLRGDNAPPFEVFARLLELHQAGLFDDVLLRLRRCPAPAAEEELAADNAGVLRYEELSDGEQMVLGRMALFHLLRDQNDALLLLDEPETHFNDKWKREIVDIIDDAIGETRNDVLISTHSAIVLSDVFNDEIVMVQKTAEGSGVRSVDEQTFATDPSALMMTVFGADDSIGKRAQEYIEALLKQADGGTDDIAKLEALISRMGSGFYRSELRTLLNTWRSGNAQVNS